MFVIGLIVGIIAASIVWAAVVVKAHRGSFYDNSARRY